MTVGTRAMLIATLILATSAELSAQTKTSTTTNEKTTAAATSTEAAEGTAAAAAVESRTGHEIRTQFTALLERGPSELPTILKLDPTLLSNDAFLTGYPDIAAFVAKHPEVRHNPRFYLSAFRLPSESNQLDEIFSAIAVAVSFVTIAFALGWLVRTLIEQKRWNQLSRRQSEVHNKILDRFSTSAELLEYIKSSAGTKFLESAPIPVQSKQVVQNVPLARVMWSIQIGVVVIAAGIGMLLVHQRFEPETAQGIFAMGAIAASIGAGFIVSGFVSLMLSRRLGLWQDESGLVR